MSSVQEEKPSDGTQKTHVHDIRNTELVSRLLAATPPYLYSALPLQPHAFFFSEMLRSFVSARHGCRPTHYQRRFKRRTHKYFAENETDWRREWPKQDDEKKDEPRPEVPLELTVDKQTRVCSSPRRLSPKAEPSRSSGSPGPQERQSSYVDVGTEELPKPAPCVGRTSEPAVTSNLILPPPPPMWYPPIYNPQFGVDPLNFFIDLRVSGHIYDRKRPVEDTEQSVPEERPEESLEKRLTKDFVQRPRHLSAFSVPVRGNTEKCIDNRISGGNTKSTSYIVKNLKRVYEDLHTQHKNNGHVININDTKAESSDIENDI